MGLFSRKTIISVASVIYPMGETGDAIPDVVKANVITAGLQHRSVPGAIRASILDGVGVKLAQGFSYARTKYYAGMPKGLPTAYNEKDDRALELLLKENLSKTYPSNVVDILSVTVKYDDDFLSVAQNQVMADWDYDFDNDETLSANGDVQVGASVVMSGPFYDWTEEALHGTDVNYHLVFTNPDDSVVEVDEWYPASIFEGHEQRVPRVLADYTLDGSPQITFTYRYGGTDPRLNLYLRQLLTHESGTFPAIVLKKNNVYLDDNRFTGSDWKTSSAWRTSKQYGNRMKIDIQTIIDKIKDNADQGDIDYAFIQPGVILTSTTQAAKQYFFNYFYNLYNVHPDNKPAYDDWYLKASHSLHSTVKRQLAENCPAQSFRIYDPDNQANSVDMEIAWRYMTYEVKTGTLTDEYEHECGPQELVESWYITRTIFKEKYDVTKFYLRKRLTSTTYAELCIVGLWHENYVYKGHSVQSGVWDMFNTPDGDFGTGFIVPLDYGILISMGARDRLQLAQEAFHLVFNCYVARKQKWYETGIFRVILVIISAVIIYFSAGTLSGFVSGLFTYFNAALVVTLGATLAAAVAALITALIVAVVYVGISFVAKETGKWAAEHWGAAWGAIVQIAVTIALSYGVGQLPGMPAIPPSTLADSVLMSGSYILSAMSAYTEYEYVALKNEIKTWQDYATGEDNPLKQVEDLMKEMFPDLTFAQQALLPHPESMEEFLGRTLTLVDGLTNRLFTPVHDMVELTLTPRLP